MADPDNNGNGDGGARPAPVVQFPHSRVRPPGGPEPYKDLGIGRMAELLGVAQEQTTGHWCRNCKGIWFGYLLEVECPVCGNRNG
jgi:hypothetical protein